MNYRIEIPYLGSLKHYQESFKEDKDFFVRLGVTEFQWDGVILDIDNLEEISNRWLVSCDEKALFFLELYGARNVRLVTKETSKS